jgi:hypothetical protein
MAVAISWPASLKKLANAMPMTLRFSQPVLGAACDTVADAVCSGIE